MFAGYLIQGKLAERLGFAAGAVEHEFGIHAAEITRRRAHLDVAGDDVEVADTGEQHWCFVLAAGRDNCAEGFGRLRMIVLAGNTQIDGQKQRRSELEDQVLLSYDEEEQAKEHLARAKEETKTVEKSVAEEEEDIRRRAEEDKELLEERRLDRKGLEESIGAKLLARYEAIRGRGGGTAVVSVARGACGGCHTHLPPQKVNEIRKRDALHHCDFCGRFLLWNVEEAAAS